MDTVDNIPIFKRYSDKTQPILKELYWIIKEYNAVLTLNQALLLRDYERNLRGNLHTLLEEMYDEHLSCGLKDDFFINWVITEEHIKDCKINEDDINEFLRLQSEFKLVNKIKAVLSTNKGGTINGK